MNVIILQEKMADEEEIYFDAVLDGNNITRSKPAPEVFAKAAQMLDIDCENCMIV